MFYLQLWNLVAGLSYHWTILTENFSIIAYSQMKLYLFKVTKSDACIRPLFANSVAFLVIQHTLLYHGWWNHTLWTRTQQLSNRISIITRAGLTWLWRMLLEHWKAGGGETSGLVNTTLFVNTKYILNFAITCCCKLPYLIIVHMIDCLLRAYEM